ncbi:type III-B CRISPR-associated protein Cas10/Cmr2 [Maridesulfovibrio bastinii]|uniref:type III-B CRISPR-associated protein Cas10/Cmr2 n=1 Tax=Maridesulfovibrio bastinii TaxID=47157 RepID=UPI00041A6D3A|nr:type III-B CRISPR-associated protein Cas10/Cmr2 [Maridesulfovibrio bastinii]
MSDTLLLISIGPVQDFIASARKLRDLWVGSRMLSEFSKTVARTLAENGADLIFPAPERMEELVNGSELIVANKILVSVNSPEEADRIQQEARQAWQAHFNSLGESTRSVLESEFNQISINLNVFDAELRDYGEFYAAWTPIAESYQDARARVESLLAARKNFRAFKAPEWNGFKTPKSSLDGMRESVFMEKPHEIIGLLKRNEHLDAIGCIKRFGFLAKGVENKYFSDLAEMALIPWIIGAENGDISHIDLIEKFQNSFPDKIKVCRGKRLTVGNLSLNVDAEKFFSDRAKLDELYGNNAKNIWDCRDEMFKKYGKPSPYSVIMVGDGDHMGEMIRSIPNKEMHKQFSRKLSNFSNSVATIVEEAGGSLIYAGGDDIMSYLPLHTAVMCADEIRKRFHSEMKSLCESIGLNVNIAATFSIGLAIVHYMHPLDLALELARKAEFIAKESGRNSLAVIQSKRAGAEVIVHGKWDADGDLPGIAERLKYICSMYSSESQLLPSKLGYDLKRVKIATGGNSEMEFAAVDGDIRPENVTAVLVRRVFDQKNQGDIEKNKQLRELLIGRKDVDQLSNELVIGRLISQAQIMAKGKVAADE